MGVLPVKDARCGVIYPRGHSDVSVIREWMIDTLFAYAAKNTVRQDGVFQPTIHSRITDTSL